MEGVTIIETARLEQMERNVETLVEFVNKAVTDLQNASKPYMTEQEVIEFTGMSRTTVYRHRDEIGFSRPAGTNRFKRTDVINFMNQSYHKNN